MPGLDGVTAVSAALVPRWDRGRSRRQFPSRQGRAGTAPSPAFAVSASFAAVSIELAILDCDPSRSDCQQAASHWHFSRASAHAGFDLGELTIGSNGRTDDVTEMMPRSRSAPTRATPTAATPAIASITMDLRVQPRTRRKPSRGSTHCTRKSDPAARGNGGLWHVDVIRRVNRTLATRRCVH